MDEVIASIVDGKVVILETPKTARISWELLALATPGLIDIADGEITLAGQVVYRIVGAEQKFAVVELVGRCDG